MNSGLQPLGFFLSMGTVVSDMQGMSPFLPIPAAGLLLLAASGAAGKRLQLFLLAAGVVGLGLPVN